MLLLVNYHCFITLYLPEWGCVVKLPSSIAIMPWVVVFSTAMPDKTKLFTMFKKANVNHV